jgi:hypothetical protein
VNGSAAARSQALPGSILELLAPQDREPVQQCLKNVIEKGLPANLEVQSFALGGRKGPAVLAVEPVVVGEGIVALSVRSKELPTSLAKTQASP